MGKKKRFSRGKNETKKKNERKKNVQKKLTTWFENSTQKGIEPLLIFNHLQEDSIRIVLS